MQIDIKLGSSLYASANDIVILPLEENEKVLLNFKSFTYTLGTLIITVRMGMNEKTYKTTGEPIDITEMCTFRGYVEVNVELVSQSKTVRTWCIEPILIEEKECAYQAFPGFDALKSDISTLKKAVSELAQLIEETNEI